MSKITLILDHSEGGRSNAGLLCEDNEVLSSSLACGYQIRGKLIASKGERDHFYIDASFENFDRMQRILFSSGYTYRFGKAENVEFGVEMGQRVIGGSKIAAALSIGLKLIQ